MPVDQYLARDLMWRGRAISATVKLQPWVQIDCLHCLVRMWDCLELEKSSAIIVLVTGGNICQWRRRRRQREENIWILFTSADQHSERNYRTEMFSIAKWVPFHMSDLRGLTLFTFCICIQRALVRKHTCMSHHLIGAETHKEAASSLSPPNCLRLWRAILRKRWLLEKLNWLVKRQLSLSPSLVSITWTAHVIHLTGRDMHNLYCKLHLSNLVPDCLAQCPGWRALFHGRHSKKRRICVNACAWAHFAVSKRIQSL